MYIIKLLAAASLALTFLPLSTQISLLHHLLTTDLALPSPSHISPPSFLISPSMLCISPLSGFGSTPKSPSGSSPSRTTHHSSRTRTIVPTAADYVHALRTLRYTASRQAERQRSQPSQVERGQASTHGSSTVPPPYDHARTAEAKAQDGRYPHTATEPRDRGTFRTEVPCRLHSRHPQQRQDAYLSQPQISSTVLALVRDRAAAYNAVHKRNDKTAGLRECIRADSSGSPAPSKGASGRMPQDQGLFTAYETHTPVTNVCTRNTSASDKRTSLFDPILTAGSGSAPPPTMRTRSVTRTRPSRLRLKPRSPPSMRAISALPDDAETVSPHHQGTKARLASPRQPTRVRRRKQRAGQAHHYAPGEQDPRLQWIKARLAPPRQPNRVRRRKRPCRQGRQPVPCRQAGIGEPPLRCPHPLCSQA